MGGAYGEGTWEYYVLLEGWASSVTLDLYSDEGGLWTEYHLFDNTSFDQCGAWGEWTLELDVVADYRAYASCETTLYAGSDRVEDWVSFMITIYDMDGAHALCGIWGEDPAFFGMYGCEILEF